MVQKCAHWGISAFMFFALTACTNTENNNRSVAIQQDQQLGQLAEEIAHKKAKKKKSLQEEKEIARLEEKLEHKLHGKPLTTANVELLSQATKDHTKLYQFNGDYKVMVIPVEFSDTAMVDKDFFESPQAQDYLFGSGENTLSQYYKHASGGKFHVKGEVTPVIKADGSLADYGEAVTGRSDKNARGLVVDALKKLKRLKTNEAWWEQFDNWDLGDYDKDGNYHEPDGFLDAVVLVYAGKAQSSCQRSFDPNGTRPASADVPEGPRKASAVECFNRIWPHRWSISLSLDDPSYTKDGPLVEGIRRPSMNGLKITDRLFALDYNMQSEFSDRSTFIHEFGHSISLPDVYARSGANSSGSWEVMSSNAGNQAQEMSTYSKISLGWVKPKIITEGQSTSLYLGHYNFYANQRRENYYGFSGPTTIEERVAGQSHEYDVVSTLPGYGEGVYRSAVVLTSPSEETNYVFKPIERVGQQSAYSGRFDGASKSIKFNFVKQEGVDQISIDMAYHIETEVNFNSNDEEIKVVTDFDLGHIFLNGQKIEDLRTISGDNNFDTINESNPLCNSERVLSLRAKKIRVGLNDSELEEFKLEVATCQRPIWLNKVIDVSAVEGEEINLEIQYVTDAGYTEFGIIVDNVQYGNEIIDFEDGSQLGEFKSLKNGQESIFNNQFYLFEYRDPKTIYMDQEQKSLSYNMDRNISTGVQGYFKDGLGTLRDNFRLLTFDYQPGVLVWYFNSKFNRNENSPKDFDGKGYLLVLNSKIKELPLPETLGQKVFFNSEGYYDQENESYKKIKDDQRAKFVCFSHTKYSTYLTGETPDCSAYEGEVDLMQSLKINYKGVEKALIYRREGFNEVLPRLRPGNFGVGVPFRHGAQIRTGLATFRPATEGDATPLNVYKEVDGQMILDVEATAKTAKFAAVDSFKDKDNSLHPSAEYRQDSAVVEKKGFGFKVVQPSHRVTELYKSQNGEDNDNVYRQPKVKIYFSWE